MQIVLSGTEVKRIVVRDSELQKECQNEILATATEGLELQLQAQTNELLLTSVLTNNSFGFSTEQNDLQNRYTFNDRRPDR